MVRLTIEFNWGDRSSMLLHRCGKKEFKTSAVMNSIAKTHMLIIDCNLISTLTIILTLQNSHNKTISIILSFRNRSLNVYRSFAKKPTTRSTCVAKIKLCIWGDWS